MRIIVLSLAAACMLMPVSLHAQSARVQAKALFKKGTKDFAAGRHSDALAAFKQANALSPHPIMHKNIAKIYEAMFDYTRAIEFYRRYTSAKPRPRDAGPIRSHIAKLHATRANWPSLKLNTTPSGAAIRIGDPSSPIRGRTPSTLKLPARSHIIHLTKRGYTAVKRSVLFEANAHRQMTVTLTSASKTPAPVFSATPAPRAAPRQGVVAAWHAGLGAGRMHRA